MLPTKSAEYVSIHGGHSGQFCSHAADDLEEIIQAYIQAGFLWVGITEHAPARSEEYLPPEEKAAGLNFHDDLKRFEHYFATARSLQKKYTNEIRLYIGFETEFFIGYTPFIQSLINKFAPDYIAGSLHHVHDYFIDGSEADFQKAIQLSGSLDQLYLDYFDRQLLLMQELKPAVVSHFDLIRLNDLNYHERLAKKEIWNRIMRNLHFIKQNNMIMDFNLRALKKGQSEPYISKPILQQALALGIPVVPGDDSHGVADVGHFMNQGIEILISLGFDTDWAVPC